MAAHSSQEDRSRRLQQQAADWKVTDLPALASLTRRLSTHFRTANDDRLVEELLKRRRLNAENENSQSGLRRAFTTNKKKKGWEPKEIFDVLDAHVTNCGSPGIAEALIFMLTSAGGNLNVPSSKRTSVIPRRRSLDSLPQRSRILQKAVENRQTDMVTVLVHHADHHALDQSLPIAIRSGDAIIVEILLQHGADASQTPEGQDAFTQICSTGGHPDLVQLILQSEGRPSPTCVSECLVSAARKGCIGTVLRLTRSVADGNHRDAAALKEAVSQGRVDIALAILTGNMPPTGKGLNKAFGKLSEHRSIMPNEKMALTEALLCAGASGDVVSEALVQACEVEFYDMVDSLVSYGASVEYQDATVLRTAISKGQSGLVALLLTEQTSLSRIYASECMEHIPKQIFSEDRHALLSALLRKGAGGSAVHDALIDAVKARDIQSVELLLTPHFPGGQSLPGRKGSSGMVYDRHEIASVDHRSGEALRIAVITSNIPIVKQLISSKPSPQTLSSVFSQIRDLSPADRYQIAELFLATGLTGPCVSSALQEAAEEVPPRRDDHFINLLLSYNADVNFNDGAGILSAIAHEDADLLARLLKNQPSPQTAAAGISKAITIVDRPRRYKIISQLIEAGAGRESSNNVSGAVVFVLQSKPVDAKLMDLLLDQGQADVNFMQGLPLVHAIHDPNPVILKHVLQKGNPSAETLVIGLNTLSEVPSTAAKTAKVEAMLRRTKHKDSMDNMLVKEVQMLIKLPHDQRTLATLGLLLSSGADVNTQTGTALLTAISVADAPVSDLLFAARPTPTTLAASLPHALHITDPMDRLSFTKKLIQAGAPDSAANQALVHAVKSCPDDIPLIHTLATRADPSDGEALASAIRQERNDLVELLLAAGAKRYRIPTLNTNFVDAMTRVTDKPKRLEICTLLLSAGASGSCVSDALLAAAADGDTALGAVLLDKGSASVDDNDGKAVLEACRSGAAEVLAMLLGTKAEIKKTTLAQGFQAATEVGDLKKRADVFRLLLEKGVSGEVVDAQLVSAARFGQDGRPLVMLLLEFGADVNYNNGEAVWTATRSAILGSLALMLGVADVGGRQRKPNRATISKALKASWKLSKEPRYQVIEWVFQAGYKLTEEQMHTTLVKAVKDEPDLRLIKLLLANGATPLANGCQCLTDAVQGPLLDVLVVFLEGNIPQKDLDWTFKQAFTSGSADVWLSEKGYEAASMLLEKGARGDGLAVALGTAIDAYGSGRDQIARRLVDLLVKHDVDVNRDDGLVVQKAAERADSQLIQQVLTRKPSTHTISMAFPYILEGDIDEPDLLQLIALFTEYHDGEERLDVMFTHPRFEPVLFQAVSQYPRSVKILQALFDAGFYHDQVIMDRVMPEHIEEDEQVSLLLWALLQPQKVVSDSVIELLIQRGAKVNFETPLSRTTPLMLAVQNKRKDIVRSILLAGADLNVADVVDATGNTPLTMATRIGGEIGTTMMTNILAADPSKNDGSLHNAARELNLRAVQVLVNFGHELDFPSPLHGGRSALGELCLNAAYAGPLTAAQEKSMEKIMTYLLDQGSDPAVHSDGKSILILALESADPVPTTRILLKVGMWRHVNEEFNNYTDGNHVYSPTQYVLRLMPQSNTTSELMALLRARAKDTFYAVSGPQPDGATNIPDDIKRAERARVDRLERIAAETEDHKRALAREKETAAVENEIFAQRAQLEEAKSRRELDLIRDRGVVEDELFARALQRKKAGYDTDLRHEADLAKAGAKRVKMIGDADLDVQGRKQMLALEYEKQLDGERLSSVNQMSAARIRERKEIDRFEQMHDKRILGRIEQQKRLVEKQGGLADKLLTAGVNPRQIGYVDELD